MGKEVQLSADLCTVFVSTKGVQYVRHVQEAVRRIGEMKGVRQTLGPERNGASFVWTIDLMLISVAATKVREELLRDLVDAFGSLPLSYRDGEEPVDFKRWALAVYTH